MKKTCCLLGFIFLFFISYSQPVKPAPKHAVYLKKYISNNLSVQLHGYNVNDKFIAHGSVKTFFANNNPAAIGNYVDGLPNGKWNLYYENGGIKTTSNYLQGVLNGPLKTYYTNGKIASVVPYQNGKIEGTATHYFRNGKMRSEITYKKKRIKSLAIYKNGLKATRLTFFNDKPTKTADEVQFNKICVYEGSNIDCYSIEEFMELLYGKGFTTEDIANVLAGLKKNWANLGLKGDVMVQCANGVLGIEDIGSPAVSNTHTSGAPNVNTVSADFKAKVDDACSRAMLDNSVGENNPKFNGDKLGGLNSRSPEQNRIDKAKAKMDQLAKDCKDGGNSMIEVTPIDEINSTLSFMENLKKYIDKFRGKITGDGSPVAVYRISQGVFRVEEFDANYGVTRNSDGSSTVSVVYNGIYEGYANTIRTRQTCVVAEDAVQGCITEAYVYGLGWKNTEELSIGSPTNFKTDAQIKRAVKGVDCALNNSESGCDQYTKDINTTSPQGTSESSNPENNGSKCDQIRSAWAKMKEECEKANWQTQKCIEMVYFMNGCPIDLTITDPLPEDGLYFGCGGANVDPAQIECEHDKMIWATNSMPDGTRSSECINKDDITKGIPSGYDPCGPEVMPTDEQGCHPVTGVPSEGGSGPSPEGNPVGDPRFVNKLGSFEEYVQQNKYMERARLSKNKLLSELRLKQVSDESFSTFNKLTTKKSIVIFYSYTCAPSMKYLNDIQKNISTLEKNAVVSICDIEQNPELREKYKIEFTPTSIVISENKLSTKVLGANKLPDIQKAVN